MTAGWLQNGTRTGACSPIRKDFRGGIRRLADQAHAAGLKLGIYSDCGTKTCGGLPASYGHEALDAETCAAWEVDYLKHDWCHVPLDQFPGKTEGEVAEILYGRMSEALGATGRPIFFSLCNWGHGSPWEWARGLGHAWRTTSDITDLYRGTDRNSLGLVEIYHRNVALADFAGPGGFNDPDMLEVGNGGMTDIEYRSHFALWCLMAAPLLVGCDIRTMSAATRGLLTHRGLIRINQDRLGLQARLWSSRHGVSVLRKLLDDGSVAVALFNERDVLQETVVDWTRLGRDDHAGDVTIRDVWTGQETTRRGSETLAVEPHATRVFQLVP